MTQKCEKHIIPCALSAHAFLFYQHAIYHDASDGNVYVSSTEGKSWARAEDIPKGEAAMVIEHPFDNRYVRNNHLSTRWHL